MLFPAAGSGSLVRQSLRREPPSTSPLHGAGPLGRGGPGGVSSLDGVVRTRRPELHLKLWGFLGEVRTATGL